MKLELTIGQALCFTPCFKINGIVTLPLKTLENSMTATQAALNPMGAEICDSPVFRQQ